MVRSLKKGINIHFGKVVEVDTDKFLGPTKRARFAHLDLGESLVMPPLSRINKAVSEESFNFLTFNEGIYFFCIEEMPSATETLGRAMTVG